MAAVHCEAVVEVVAKAPLRTSPHRT